ncbi:ankyrin repeat-containing protein, putative [Ricinus communis]|uniref:Ankyrin repeat-containing protein, putative n=1 Tax=Ricinus communis TaxID=3988 RepID=B9RM72_RICCO|nr:ankyrin repeat-containing protein, putative [Ricinus communis]
MDPSLYQAITSGDLNSFNNLIRNNPSKLLQVTADQENTILHVAAKLEVLQIAERVIGLCPPLLHKPNFNGDSPLHIAARLGRVRMCRLLINCANLLEVEVEKELLRMQNLDHDTALHDAVRNGHFETVRLLIQQDSQLTRVINKAGESPLFLAVDRRSYEISQHILQAAPAVCSFKGRNSMNVLHAAIIRSNFMHEVIRRCPFATSERDIGGWIPLHYAAYSGYSEVVELMLHHDISLAHVKDQKGKAVVHISAKAGRRNVIRMLIETCPDTFELLDDRGRTALHIAAEKGRIRVLRILLNNPILEYLINARDKNGNTPFHLAASRGHLTILRVLATDGRVDKAAINNAGLTALDIVESSTPPKNYLKARITRILIKRGSLPSMEQRAIVRNTKQKAIEAQEQGQSQKVESKAQPEESKSQRDVKEKGKYNLVVSTIIASITFSAICNLPGGNYSDSKDNHQIGKAILSDDKNFKSFIISNSTAFGLAFTSILLHFLASVLAKRRVYLYARLINIAFVSNYISAFVILSAYIAGLRAVLPKSLADDTLTQSAVGLLVLCFLSCLLYVGSELRYISYALSQLLQEFTSFSNPLYHSSEKDDFFLQYLVSLEAVIVRRGINKIQRHPLWSMMQFSVPEMTLCLIQTSMWKLKSKEKKKNSKSHSLIMFGERELIPMDVEQS